MVDRIATYALNGLTDLYVRDVIARSLEKSFPGVEESFAWLVLAFWQWRFRMRGRFLPPSLEMMGE
jgi:hypothetical protein